MKISRSRLLSARPAILRSGAGFRCRSGGLAGKRLENDDLRVELADLDDRRHHALRGGSPVDDMPPELTDGFGKAALGPTDHRGLAAVAHLIDLALGAVDVDRRGS